nr:hypothetical protein HmN_000766200 [Hymenolepis microstoma]
MFRQTIVSSTQSKFRNSFESRSVGYVGEWRCPPILLCSGLKNTTPHFSRIFGSGCEADSNAVSHGLHKAYWEYVDRFAYNRGHTWISERKFYDLEVNATSILPIAHLSLKFHCVFLLLTYPHRTLGLQASATPIHEKHPTAVEV